MFHRQFLFSVSLKFVFLSFLEIPQHNINQSEAGVGDKKFSIELCGARKPLKISDMSTTLWNSFYLNQLKKQIILTLSNGVLKMPRGKKPRKIAPPPPPPQEITPQKKDQY